MADTAFRSDGNLAVEHWSAMVYREAERQQFLKKFTGPSSNAIIQVKEDLTRKRGDKITFPLVMDLDGTGRTGDQELEGYEESMTFYDFQVQVYLRANAVRSAGKMSDRLTMINFKKEAKTALGRWMGSMQDDDTILALSGLANPAIVDDDGTVVTANAPSTNRRFIGGQTTGGTLSDNLATDSLLGSGSGGKTYVDHLFGTQVISRVKRMAKLANPMVKPIMVDGEERYVVVIHPYQAKDLRAESAWQEAQRGANIRGESNPIFSGALGIWDGVIVHEYDRITTRLGDGTGTDPTTYWESGDPLDSSSEYAARALFLGAQACCKAWAQRPGWYEKQFQYGRVPGVATDTIYNVEKTEFNSEDFGVIAIDTCYTADS